MKTGRSESLEVEIPNQSQDKSRIQPGTFQLLSQKLLQKQQRNRRRKLKTIQAKPKQQKFINSIQLINDYSQEFTQAIELVSGKIKKNRFNHVTSIHDEKFLLEVHMLFTIIPIKLSQRDIDYSKIEIIFMMLCAKYSPKIFRRSRKESIPKEIIDFIHALNTPYAQMVIQANDHQAGQLLSIQDYDSSTDINQKISMDSETNTEYLNSSSSTLPSSSTSSLSSASSSSSSVESLTADDVMPREKCLTKQYWPSDFYHPENASLDPQAELLSHIIHLICIPLELCQYKRKEIYIAVIERLFANNRDSKFLPKGTYQVTFKDSGEVHFKLIVNMLRYASHRHKSRKESRYCGFINTPFDSSKSEVFRGWCSVRIFNGKFKNIAKDRYALKVRPFNSATKDIKLNQAKRAYQMTKCSKAKLNPKEPIVHECSIYSMMRYISGINLLDYLKYHSALSVKNMFMLLIMLIRAYVKQAWQNGNGLIHRDIKPENIIIRKNRRCKIIDWEDACQIGDDDHMFPGTLQYNAPEKTMKQSNNTATDVYSLGIIFALILLQSGSKAYDLQSAKDFDGTTYHIKALGILVDKMRHQDNNKRPEPNQIKSELKNLYHSYQNYT